MDTKPSDIFKKLVFLDMDDIADTFAGAALENGVHFAMVNLQAALRVEETGEWDEATERALFHQGEHAVVRMYKDEILRTRGHH